MPDDFTDGAMTAITDWALGHDPRLERALLEQQHPGRGNFNSNLKVTAPGHEKQC
jgi:hypothetical protein